MVKPPNRQFISQMICNGSVKAGGALASSRLVNFTAPEPVETGAPIRGEFIHPPSLMDYSDFQSEDGDGKESS